MDTHEEDWRAYPIEINDTMGFTMTDIGWEVPPADQPWCLRVSVELADPGPQGLGSTSEMEAIAAGEDAFLGAAEQAGLIHVARIRHGGEVTWVFYAEGEGLLEEIGETASEALERDVGIAAEEDPDWGIYAALLPSPAVQRWLMDSDVVNALTEQGDGLSTPREVRHYAYFDDPAEAERFAQSAAAEGFTHELLPRESEDDACGVVLTHESAVDLETINQVTLGLDEKAEACGGEYDGWECRLVKAGE